MRYRITLSYDGEPFCGWQIQPDAPSVQGALESALSKLHHGTPVQVVGAGRTDTAVSAVDYVAHFDSEAQFEPEEMVRKLNSILPRSIAVSGLEPAAPDFHARFDATRREYTFFIHRTKDPFAAKSFLCSWPSMDFEAMNAACAPLIGQHDFSCFEKTGADNKTSVCTVYEAFWLKRDETHWEFHIAANRFLRNMVRAIVGTLIEVGRGKRSPESVEALLQSQDRCEAGESVPGNALFLTGVHYD